MSAFVRYTLARLGFFAVAFVVVGLVSSIWLEVSDVTVLWVALIALAISAVASFFLLGGLREEVAVSLKARADKMNDRLEAARGAEDVD
ncbi:DUF4229 domain-containing protein [Mumia sp. zg.B53]|uniref:DUF4229 domain-containing protein n=1 Tax=unclassified Mumia TaxID=2621872 RepID=UPI001C6E8D75|nr:MULTISPECIES: DUF4229 domain-containing protein [unclassified Mumia]MBW9204551.1 DUF4229 domain-containing protein [Mumia sp. zg.B17]MBW9209444.1 DUF4229 domain-containing protein [Mumia sp. zg.B21]MBW9214049.1 DUF4229 domain-containing protein [Mumia sp. zg.B53]